MQISVSECFLGNATYAYGSIAGTGERCGLSLVILLNQVHYIQLHKKNIMQSYGTGGSDSFSWSIAEGRLEKVVQKR